MKRSYTSSTTSAMRASGRSTLFTTRITGRCASSVLRSTNRVCGNGPSLASTSRSTPSTIASARSTSPPKSAWPGVSTMLRVTSPYRTAVFLARIVMPFSRSRSLESMTRSLTSWFSRNAPDCHKRASTRVVLPWSTWATIATLRRSSRAGIRAVYGGVCAARSPGRTHAPQGQSLMTNGSWAGCAPVGTDRDARRRHHMPVGQEAETDRRRVLRHEVDAVDSRRSC